MRKIKDFKSILRFEEYYKLIKGIGMKRLLIKTLLKSAGVIDRESLKKIHYLPRWITFFTDVTILVMAVIGTHAIVSQLSDFSYSTLSFFARYTIVVGVNMFFFMVFRTYSGIVRHSTF